MTTLELSDYERRALACLEQAERNDPGAKGFNRRSPIWANLFDTDELDEALKGLKRLKLITEDQGDGGKVYAITAEGRKAVRTMNAAEREHEVQRQADAEQAGRDA